MAYMNRKAGVDECPQIKKDYVNAMFLRDVDLLSTMPNNKKRYPCTPFMLSVMSRLTDVEIQNSLHPDNVRELSKRLGYPSIRSGLWGASVLARKKVESKLGPNSFIKYEQHPGSRKWGIFATSLDALRMYEDELKYNIEWLIGRSL